MALLDEYRRKRRFDRTPEPTGDKASPALGASNRFVVQKHDARRLHYDFRLEIEGLLKSWAVPKGPSLNPADKRLAMQTEDHPLDYFDFEGVIPEGQYGAGPVMVWDLGTFQPEGDLSASQQLAQGELKFVLHGRKLRGSFVLVKLRQPEKSGKDRPWLLIKHKDFGADPHWNIDEHDGSVLTARNLKEIDEGLPDGGALEESSTILDRRYSPAEIEGARHGPMPDKLQPMLATLADNPFSDPDWLFEIKWDGVRALAWVRDGKVELRARTGRIVTLQYPELATLPTRLGASQALLDGEIVVPDEHGHSDFERFQERMNVQQPSAALQRKAPLTYYLFDLLYCDGYDLRESPLAERKELLRRILEVGDPFRYADHVMEKGKELFELAKEQGLEGIVGKHVGSAYVSKRSPEWVKFKVVQDLDAVIGGWTAPRGSREHFGALLVGLYERAGLRFIGGVGTGFNEKSQEEVYAQLRPLETHQCPFETLPTTKEESHWVEPQLVARVKYSNWTQERRLRAPVFMGLRPDGNPRECQFEAETATAELPSLQPKIRNTEPSTRSLRLVRAPVIAGHVLIKKGDIERELFAGHAENVNVEIEGKLLRLSNLNKVYFPETGYTKRNLLAYYYRIADYLLPFLEERPLVLRRYPDGITGPSFFQKDAREAAPEWMPTIAVYSEEKRQEVPYFTANDQAALLYLTNLGCIDQNPWPSRQDDLDHPDYFFFDLDPTDGTEYGTVVEIARAVLERLERVELTVFLKTSGATGLHLWIPVERGYTYEQVRTFAEIIGRLVAGDQPAKVTQERSVGKRRPGTVLIDASQNALGRPLAGPYTVRAFPKAPVSTPIKPSELKPTLRPDHLNIQTIHKRIEKHGDLWADFWEKRQRLEGAVEKLGQLTLSRAQILNPKS